MRHDINPGVNWRATSSMSLNLGLRYTINHDDSQWVENEDLPEGGQRYVFGRIDQKTVSFTTRFNYTMTPNLSLQVYAEPFVSAGSYSNFKELIDGRAPEYADRYKPYAYPENRRLQHPVVPHHQRVALGIQAGFGAVPGVAAGQVG